MKVFVQSVINMLFRQLHRYIFLSFLCVGAFAGAVTLDEAKEMYLQGDFAGSAASVSGGSCIQAQGCLAQPLGRGVPDAGGRDDEAVPHLKIADTKGIAEAPRYLAEIAFRKYDFEEAENYIAKYEKALKKSRKTMPEGAQAMIDRIDLAKTMLDRVERIVIIDSVTVDKEDFFKAYRMTPESGSLNTAEVLPEGRRPLTLLWCICLKRVHR